MWRHSNEPFPFERVAACYDAAARNYCRQNASLPLVEKDWLKQATSSLRTNAVAVDVGCGSGLATRCLQGLEIHTVGIDVSAGMLEAAARTSGAGIWEMADARALPLRNQSIDVYVAWYSLIHLSDDETRQALSEAVRILTPGGVFVATVHTAWHGDSRRFDRGWISTDDFLETKQPLGLRLIEFDTLHSVLQGVGLVSKGVFRRFGVEADDELPTERVAVFATKRH